MWITFRSDAHEEIWANSAMLIGVIIPSPLSPSDGKCRVITSGMVVTVTKQTAEELLSAVTEKDPAIDVRSGDVLTLTRQ